MVTSKKLYKKWYFLKFFKVKNFIQIYTKTHQIAPFIKNFLGGHAPKSPSKVHDFIMRSMSLCDMQISKSQKKVLAPSQILGTPLLCDGFFAVFYIFLCGLLLSLFFGARI